MIKQDFISKLRKSLHGKTVLSVADNVTYSVNVAIGEGLVKGTRQSTGNEYKVDINELLNAYNECDRPLKTSKLKYYISTRAQSPALAILLEFERLLEQENK